jgi:hypothetical protein
VMGRFVYDPIRVHAAPLRKRFETYLEAAPEGIDSHPDPESQVRLFYLVHGLVAVHPDFFPGYAALLDSKLVDEFPGMREGLIEQAAEELLDHLVGSSEEFPESMPYASGSNRVVYGLLYEAGMLWWQYSSAEAELGELMEVGVPEVDQALNRAADREDALHLFENLLFADDSDPLDLRFPLLAMLEDMDLSDFVRRFPWTEEAGYPAEAHAWFATTSETYRNRFPKAVLR